MNTQSSTPANRATPGELPVDRALPELHRALADRGVAVLVAAPGAGKTTRVPPSLVDQPWAAGRILVLEPRRMAARAAARRMAAEHDEQLGQRFGYSVRHDRRVSAGTRVEVLTEGLLLRRLQADPGLNGVSAVLLDEFHERSVDADLALALLLDTRGSIRPDLRLVVMSATLDAAAVAEVLCEEAPAPIVEVDAAVHPVQTHYRQGSAHDRIEDRVVDVVIESLNGDHGDLLVFLPGRGEIAGVGRRLRGRLDGVEVLELHGGSTPDVQERVLTPHLGQTRRVVLATAVAETSLTVPGVRVVVDSGLRRTQVTDPRSGLPSLVTTAICNAGADQRRGRSAREAAGVCYRLWARNDDQLRRRYDPPEIEVADLSALLLQVMAWGAASPAELRWMDPPPDDALARATRLLHDLDALEPDGRLSGLGKRIAGFGFHPRLGAVAVAGETLGIPALASEVLAVLEVGGPGDPNLAERVRHARSDGASSELHRSAQQWRRNMSGTTSVNETVDDDLEELVGRLVLAGFSDRLARRRARRTPTRGNERVAVFQLRHGGEVETRETDAPANAEWIIACDLDLRVGQGRPGRLHLGAALNQSDVDQVLQRHAVRTPTARWDPSTLHVTATVQSSLDAITISSEPWREPDQEVIRSAMTDAVRDHGVQILGRWNEADPLRNRVAFLRTRDVRRCDGGSWPDMSESHLCDTASQWLFDLLEPRHRDALARVDVVSALRSTLGWDDLQLLDQEAPTRWHSPTGDSFALTYGTHGGDAGSVLMTVRLQRLLGLDVHPTIGSQHVPVTLELTSPAGRSVQLTTDLPGFWRGSYAQVRAELRGRYRKHRWPAEPWRVNSDGASGAPRRGGTRAG